MYVIIIIIRHTHTHTFLDITVGSNIQTHKDAVGLWPVLRRQALAVISLSLSHTHSLTHTLTHTHTHTLLVSLQGQLPCSDLRHKVTRHYYSVLRRQSSPLHVRSNIVSKGSPLAVI